MDDFRVLVVGTEAVSALIVTILAWLLRHRRAWVFFLFPLLGATWFALAHGLAFFSDGDAGGLAGFGMVVALFFGLPAGFLAGGVAFVWWLFTRKPSDHERAA